MHMSSVFETYTLSRDQLTEWPTALSKIRTQIEKSEIKIVDIRRDGNQLIIVYRKLYSG